MVKPARGGGDQASGQSKRGIKRRKRKAEARPQLRKALVRLGQGLKKVGTLTFSLFFTFSLLPTCFFSQPE
jgi:hypothetical protein